MSANKVVVVSVSLYIIVFLVSAIVFFNTKFTGSDAAGNGMASGLTFLYGLAVLFIIAVVLTGINAFFFKNISLPWVKVLFFVPLLLPLLAFSFEFFGTGRPEASPLDEEAYRLSYQIRATEELTSPRLSFVSSIGVSAEKITFKKKEGGFYIYGASNPLFFDDERSFYISSDYLTSEEYYLDIPYEPESIPFGNWEELIWVNGDLNETLKLEFRYSVTKLKIP